MNLLTKIAALMALPIVIYAKTVSLDSENVAANLKNNAVNLLTFPFVVYKANIVTENPENYTVTAKNSSLVILPTAEGIPQETDLVIWSVEGDAHIIKLSTTGKEQKFTFSSNKLNNTTPIAAKKYETGKIEQDIKKLIKKSVLNEKIPGYKKVEVKKMFETPDLNMQKEYYYDGGKYRVETWYLQNKSSDNLTLDFENFYTNGILAIAFEKNNINPGQISKMWLVVNKSSIAEKIERNKR